MVMVFLWCVVGWGCLGDGFVKCMGGRKAMKFWVAHSGEVPVREQIVAQVGLGIASGELGAGARLPSTREMARRFGVHPNTVSGAYGQLEREGKVESRRGSGVYVLQATEASGAVAVSVLDRLIAGVFAEARAKGLAGEAVRARMRAWLAVSPADHFVVVEPDAALRAIVMAEVREVVGLPVVGVEEFHTGEGGVAVALPSKAARVRGMLGAGEEMVELQVTRAAGEMTHWLPGPEGALVGICSGWPEFLKVARAVLVGAGVAAEALVVRDARERGWERGLEGTVAVVCDVVVAGEMPRGVKAIPFRLLGVGSVAELRRVEGGIRERLGLGLG